MEASGSVIYPSRHKTIGLALTALIFVGLGVLFAFYRQELELPILLVIISSYIGVPFFGAALLYLLYRLLVPKPALVLSGKGLTDNASLVGVGFLAWEEIEEIVVYEFMNQKFMGIVPKEENTVLGRLPSWKRALLRANNRLGTAPINIPQTICSVPLEQLAEQALALRDRYTQK